MDAIKLKKRILVFLLISKLLALVFIWGLTVTYGFTPQEALGVVLLILPLFTVYLGIMVEDLIRNPYLDSKLEAPLKVKSEITTLVNIIFPVYTVLILVAIFLGAIKFFDLKLVLGIIESGFGFYVGKIVVALFRAKPDAGK